MTSTTESTQRSRPVSTAAIVTHDRVDVDEAVRRVRALSDDAGVSIVDDPRQADLVVALGGDGTILRTLATLLGSDVAVIGVNFGRVGFLASIRPERLDEDLRRVFAGEYTVVELPTLEVKLNGERHVAVNDVVATSSTLGRMVELTWRSAARSSGGCRATASSARRRPARPRTTSRTAGRFSSAGSTRWRSRSSHRTRCTRGRSSSRAGRR
jgi:NAD kinase